jgi:hypothetical protein
VVPVWSQEEAHRIRRPGAASPTSALEPLLGAFDD